MDSSESAGTHSKEADDVIDLFPVRDAETGKWVWIEGDGQMTDTTSTESRVFLQDGYMMESGSEGRARLLGNVAQGRMAGAGWDEIDRYFADEEGGRPTGMSLEARPGGEMVLVDKNRAGETQIGNTAQGRMAAANPRATPDELRTLRSIDPTNIENWVPREFGSIRGLEFRFSSRLAKPGYFKFLVLKTGNDTWRIAPLHPNMDDLFGHRHHMVSATIGGELVPVICGPGGRAATSLKEARDFAYKWSTYIEGILSGRSPRHSQ
jgi:hypothetical protein